MSDKNPTDLPSQTTTASTQAGSFTQASRRKVLKGAAASAFGFTVMPSYLATGARAQGDPQPPSKRINLGCVGAGGRANGVVPPMCQQGEAMPVALCDIDFNHAGGGNIMKQWGESARKFSDFREMLDEMGDDIDAVTVAIPDHTHFPVAIAAMQLGKHVYVEKPLTHTFREAEMLRIGAEQFGVVTQMGNQGHSEGGSVQFKAWAERGLLDNVNTIHAWKGPSLFFMKEGERFSEWPAEEEIPDHVNWDLWCGPARLMPYSRKVHPFNWRAFHEYGSGMLGDWGCHIIDFAHDYLDLGLPTSIRAVRMDDHNQVLFPLSSHIDFTFPARGEGRPEVNLHWKDGADIHPEIPEKYWAEREEDGVTEMRPPKLGGAGTFFEVPGTDYAVTRGSHGSSSQIQPRAAMAPIADQLRTDGGGTNHQRSFAQACMGEGETWSPFSVAAPLTQVCNLGMIAQYLNVDLEFDPETKSIVGNDEANALLNGPDPREGWEGFYDIIKM